MFKKVFCLLIVFSILAVAPPSVADAESADFEKYQNEAGLLAALNIADITSENFDKNISRQEFAKMLCKMTGLLEIQEGASIQSPYTDVDSQNEYLPYIAFLSEMGILNGFEDGTFRPTQEIKPIEGVTLLINMLGYGFIANSKGGFPAGYLAVAGQIKLSGLNPLSVNGLLTTGEAGMLCFKAMHIDLMRQSVFSENSGQYETESGRNILTENFKINHIRDIVNGIDVTKLRGSNDVPPWHILIGDMLLDIGDTAPNYLLGFSADAYYEIESDTLIYAFPSKGQNKVTELPLKDIIRIEGNVISILEESGRIVAYPYSRTTPVIYNEMATSTVLDMDMITNVNGTKKNGFLRLLDNNGDGRTDIVFVLCGEDFVVGQIDSTQKVVYDHYDVNRELNLDLEGDDPYVLLLDEAGKQIPFSRIGVFDVITVYSSLADAPQQYKKAYLSKRRDIVTVDEIISEGAKHILTAGGVSYIITEQCMGYFGDKIKAGVEYTLLVNVEGMVAGISVSSDTSEKYGCLIHVGTDASGIEAQFKFKILTEENTVEIFGLNKNLIIDGRSYKRDSNGISDALKKSSKFDLGASSKAVYSQIIKYSLWTDGTLKSIDTVMSDENTAADVDGITSENKLYSVGKDTQAYYVNPMSFSGKALISSQTRIFVMPPENAEEKDFMDEENYIMWTAGNLTNTNTYTYQVYFDNDDSAIASAISIYSKINTPVTANRQFSIVDRVVLAADNDNNVVEKLYIYENGAENQIFAKPGAVFKRAVAVPDTIPHIPVEISVNDLKTGDAIFYSADRTGRLVEFELIYRAEDNTIVTQYSPTSFGASKRVYAGYVFAKYNNGLKFKATDDINDMSLNSVGFEYLNIGAYTIMVYDSGQSGKNRLKAGSLNNAIGYQNAQGGCSRIIIQSYQGQPIQVYIVR